MKPFNEHGGTEIKEYKRGEYALHGDVILRFETLPEDFSAMPNVKDNCLAYGELSGHMHAIVGEPHQFELRECPKTKARHLRVVEPVLLKHQEHEQIKLPPGDYRVDIQREYDPFEKLSRRVID
jgi:hypothetical protein